MYGVTSFMGKTVGGAAGAVSRITGTIGECCVGKGKKRERKTLQSSLKTVVLKIFFE